MIDSTEWNRRVDLLHFAELKLDQYIKEKKLTRKEIQRIKKRISQMWLDIWKFHPDQNYSLEQSFDLNFR